MAELVYRQPQEGDAEELDRLLRPLDRQEIIAASGPDTLTTIRTAIERSSSVYTLREPDGTLLCIFGTVPLTMLHTAGSPWMLGTEALSRWPRTLVRVSMRYFRHMLNEFPLLINYVDQRNKPSIRLVKAIGCSVLPAEPYGAEGHPFHPFKLEIGDV